jgi:glycosidase
MAQWMKELNEAYPNYNTVGETWVVEPAYTAWWQKDSKLSAPRNSNLKTVMDFSFYDKINIAKTEQSENGFRGLDRIYNNFVYDYLYPNPASVLAFIENHDTDRYLADGDNLPMLKQASTLLLTTHRIPQLYYGTEVMMNGVKQRSDGYVRKDFPGGWAGDKASAFTADGRTKLQNECYNFYRKLLNWRKGNDVIARGSMTQFLLQKGVYAYARRYEGKSVFVLLNGNDRETTISLECYHEILRDVRQGKDVLTDRTVDLSGELTLTPRESLVIEW